MFEYNDLEGQDIKNDRQKCVSVCPEERRYRKAEKDRKNVISLTYLSEIYGLNFQLQIYSKAAPLELKNINMNEILTHIQKI